MSNHQRRLHRAWLDRSMRLNVQSFAIWYLNCIDHAAHWTDWFSRHPNDYMDLVDADVEASIQERTLSYRAT